MEALEAIKSVKSVSKYKPDPVPEQKVQTVMNAARFANSADNLQPWKFIVVSDEEDIAIGHPRGVSPNTRSVRPRRNEPRIQSAYLPA